MVTVPPRQGFTPHGQGRGLLAMATAECPRESRLGEGWEAPRDHGREGGRTVRLQPSGSSTLLGGGKVIPR